jgi:ribosomal protein S18 acetylase RimI-like enzyme
MTDEELAEWLPLMREGYARDLERDFGMSPEGARAHSDAQMDRLVPDGNLPALHTVFVIEVDGKPGGDLWLAERDDNAQPTLFIYDITVDEALRGHGYGKAAMAFVEEEARRRGLGRIGLFVGGRNEVARNLYRSVGFSEDAVGMSKNL